MKTYRERTEEILEKAEGIKKTRAARRKKLAAGLSCTLAAVLVLNLALFLPGGGDHSLADTDPTETAPAYFAVRERLASILRDFEEDDQHWADAPGGEQSAPEKVYRNLADKQTEGVTGGDLFAQSNGTAFYLTTDYRLQAYSVATASPIGEVAIKPEGGFTFFGETREMYLSDDLSSATVFTSAYDPRTQRTYTAMIGVETKDPATMSVTGVQYISGSYITSRLANGNFWVVSQFTVPHDCDLSDESEYIPQTGVLGAMEPIPAEAIFLPDEAQKPAFTVLSSLSEGGKLLAVRALLSFTGDAYFSQDAIYATGGFLAKTPTDGGAESYEYRTHVVRIAYDKQGGLALSATATVRGKIESPFSMDEWDGTLRVFATTGYLPRGALKRTPVPSETNVSLFIYEATTLRPLASKEGFAQGGESVRAARFDGDRAYVFTASRISDPLFAFDLADLGKITCTKGKIPGFAIYLTQFTDGLLLGIGSGTVPLGVNVELYDGQVVQVASSTAAEAWNDPQNFKVSCIEGEYGLVGFAARRGSDREPTYFLFRWDGETLSEAAEIPISCSPENARAFCEDGVLYLFDGTLTALPLT